MISNTFNARKLFFSAVALVALAVTAALVFAPSGGAPVEVRGATKTTLVADRTGEATLDLTASAPGTGWGREGSESAVATVRLDGGYAEDVVLFNGQQRFTYKTALGPVEKGRHTVRVTFNDAKSPPEASGIKVDGLKSRSFPTGGAVGEAAQVRRYSPILYGRNLSDIEGRYENNYTDVPMLMYHTKSTEQATGNTTIEYTIIWSNEDGGTDTPALMARFGRSTDIEWVYRVTLGPDGALLKEEYQGPGHVTTPFAGAKEGDHPLLVTSTSNNNFTPVADPSQSTGYRFFLNPTQVLPADRTREVMMDRNPWTYPIMAKELVREDKIESPASPSTPGVSDQRNYLYLELDKTTQPSPQFVGTAIVVKLAGDPKRYTSHHDIDGHSVTRDDPAATTIELPPGTTAGDVREVRALAVPINPDGAEVPRDYTVEFTEIERAFFLDEGYRPRPSFIRWEGNETLTPQRPEAVVWEAR